MILCGNSVNETEGMKQRDGFGVSFEWNETEGMKQRDGSGVSLIFF